ncbi:MAG: hypothetical protein SFV54_18555, partial [Bryobacteraceae bacterium]|nr:hypothetical protein [Bryobacteraceae bacterium]
MSQLSTPNRTDAQREASRKNGAQSKGPVTPQGKARSAANGSKRSAPRRQAIQLVDFLLATEDPSLFDEVLEDHIELLRPTHVIEQDIVRDIARIRWLIERAQRVQTALIRREYYRHILLATYRDDQEKMDLAIARAIDGSAHHYLDTVLRRERRDYFRCLRELERLRKSP